MRILGIFKRFWGFFKDFEDFGGFFEDFEDYFGDLGIILRIMWIILGICGLF